MNDPESPQRLRLAIAPGSALSAGLSQARTRGPSDAQLVALEAALAASLGAAAVGAGISAAAGQAVASTPAVAPAFASAGVLKVTAVFVALAATAGGVTMLRQRHHVEPSGPVTAASAPRRAALPALPAAITQDEPAASPVGVQRPVRAEHPPAGAHPRRVTDELALITRAQRMLASDPAAALALIEDNRRVLAQSSFIQEAEVITVAALARLGRTDEARARAARFVARFPDSVHAARMRRVAAIIK